MLNLRSGSLHPPYYNSRANGLTYLPHGSGHSAKHDFVDTVIGNLGGVVSYSEDEDLPGVMGVSGSDEIEMEEREAVREETRSTVHASNKRAMAA
ncbi:hypothetical protein EIP86_001205 [Pleurotus ostreatoroseus]|nr:hypothetical protein EIP86_001205 [Pleurotus ostreatoroseus]